MAKSKIIKVKFFDEELYAGDNVLQKIEGHKSDWIDLRASVDVTIPYFCYQCIPLGIAMQLPKGYEALVVPRSSTFKNFGIIQTNSIGVIDEKYCGDNDQWHFPCICLKPALTSSSNPADNIQQGFTEIHRGDRICQFRIIKHQPEINFEVVTSLGNEDRGGFGSTGV